MYSFGCIESTYNPNDNIFSVDSIQIPNEYSLRDILPVQNQGNIGACVSYVATEMLNFYSLQRNFVFKPDWTEFYYDRKNKEYDGADLYDRCCNEGENIKPKRLTIRGSQKRVARGIYNVLANKPVNHDYSVGWHYQYEDKFLRFRF